MRILSRFMANKHTSGAGLVYGVCLLCGKVSAILWPAHAAQILDILNEFKQSAVIYGFAMAGDSKTKLEPEKQPPSNTMKNITLLVGFGALLLALPLRAQSNAPVPVPQSQTTTAAQAAGQQFLDTVPVFSMLTNIPSATFDKAKAEIFVGIQNTGSQLNNSIAADYNFTTNFFVRGQGTLGATPSVFNSFGLGAGVRYAWPSTEVYAGIAGNRNFAPGTDLWNIEPQVGMAYKASSGMAVFAQISTLVSLSKGGNQPPISYTLGCNFAF